MSLSPNDLYEIRKIIVAAKMLDTGMFDAELSRIDVAFKAAAEQQVETIAAENSRVLSLAAQAQDELDAKEARNQATLKDIEERTAALDEKQAAYNTLSAEVGAKIDSLAALTKQAQQDTDAMYAAANVKNAEAEKREQEVVKREQALTEAQAALDAKLQALQALAK